MEIIIKKFDELTVAELYDILKLRSEVFVVEQNCVYLDIDGIDKIATHVFIVDNGKIEAYTRAFHYKEKTYKLGRIVSATRGTGLGAKVVSASINLVKTYNDADEILIEAQSYAQGFYEKLGFVVCSDEFLEDGIPHKEMKIVL